MLNFAKMILYTIKTGIMFENGDPIVILLRWVFHSQIKIRFVMKMWISFQWLVDPPWWPQGYSWQNCSWSFFSSDNKISVYTKTICQTYSPGAYRYTCYFVSISLEFNFIFSWWQIIVTFLNRWGEILGRPGWSGWQRYYSLNRVTGPCKIQEELSAIYNTWWLRMEQFFLLSSISTSQKLWFSQVCNQHT